MTEDEGLYLATLEAVLPVAMYIGDRFPPEHAARARVQVVNDTLVHLWRGMPGDPLGPGGTYRPEDLAATGWIGGMISMQVARHRAPAVRR